MTDVVKLKSHVWVVLRHAFVMTVSSMMPPRSLVKTLRVPLPGRTAAMSPTTRVSRKGTASLP